MAHVPAGGGVQTPFLFQGPSSLLVAKLPGCGAGAKVQQFKAIVLVRQ